MRRTTPIQRSDAKSSIMESLLNKQKTRTASNKNNNNNTLFIQNLRRANNINIVNATMEIESDMEKDGFWFLDHVPGIKDSEFWAGFKGDQQRTEEGEKVGHHQEIAEKNPLYNLETGVMNMLGIEGKKDKKTKKKANSAPGINQGVPSSESNPTGLGEDEESSGVDDDVDSKPMLRG